MRKITLSGFISIPFYRGLFLREEFVPSGKKCSFILRIISKLSLEKYSKKTSTDKASKCSMYKHIQYRESTL